jgi:hypothetical protein
VERKPLRRQSGAPASAVRLGGRTVCGSWEGDGGGLARSSGGFAVAGAGVAGVVSDGGGVCWSSPRNGGAMTLQKLRRCVAFGDYVHW